MRIRLGGKGYAPNAECLLVTHTKGLAEFTDLMHKLQTIVEEDSNLGYVLAKVQVRKTKSYLYQNKKIQKFVDAPCLTCKSEARVHTIHYQITMQIIYEHIFMFMTKHGMLMQTLFR